MLGIFGLLLIAMLLVLKFCKKTLKIVLSIIIVIITIYCVILSVDMNRTYSMQKPIFARLTETYGNKDIYSGVGYKIEVEKGNNSEKIISSTMYFFNKVIAGAIE